MIRCWGLLLHIPGKTKRVNLLATFEKRKSKNRTSYRARVRLASGPDMSKTFDRLSDAKEWAVEIERKAARGTLLSSHEARTRTLSDAIHKYISEILPRKAPKTVKDQTQQLLWWDSRLGTSKLSELSSHAISSGLSELLNSKRPSATANRSPATAIRYLAALSHVLSFCVKEWNWLDSNPVSRVSRPREPRGRVRFLDNKTELPRLLEACQSSNNPNLYPVVLIALHTGARKREITTLKWSNIDFDRKTMTLTNTKNRDIRTCPLRDEILAILARNRSEDTESYVFRAKRNSGPTEIRSAWERALKKAKIDDFRFHDLRHTCASYLAMSNASLTDIAEILGHRTITMTARYAHLLDDHKRSVMEKMHSKFLQHTNGNKTDD